MLPAPYLALRSTAGTVVGADVLEVAGTTAVVDAPTTAVVDVAAGVEGATNAIVVATAAVLSTVFFSLMETILPSCRR